MNKNASDLIIFRPQGNKIALEVKLKGETVWLTQAQMSELFQTERSVITKHISNTLKSKELKKIQYVHFLHILPKMVRCTRHNFII